LLSEKESLKRKFLFRLTAVILLLLLLSFSVLYIHTNSRVSQNLTDTLDAIAHKLINEKDDRLFFFARAFGVEVEFVQKLQPKTLFQKEGSYYLQKTYPNNDKIIKITMDVTSTKELERDILNAILAIIVLSIVAILFYISFLTKTFLQPIFELSHKLSDMNENFMKSIDVDALPVEFRALGKSINGLVNRIQNYIKYQKELFTGVSHELKTPLAVLKTKNQVVLIKDRDVAKYKQTLKENVEIVDEVNKMISTVLEFGRQESAQFEPATKIDILEFLRKKTDDFKMITNQRKIIVNIPEEKYFIEIQPTLLNQIFQNFMQNAIKFAKKIVYVEVKILGKKIIITVEDDGEGLPDNLDIFAPFKRGTKSQGIGLGLYLAKSAANAIGAHIDIKNATNGGTVATIEIETHNPHKLS
jgi:two-component system OmpR family sensor kinase